jgi:RNA polymerase sigma-70 factor, ECF subfamily
MAERRAGDAEETELVRAVAAGSEEALAVLYDRHGDAVHAAAYRLTGDRQIAEEVVQETFLALWNRAELFDPGLGSLGTWLRTIARNRTVDRLRAIGRRPTLVPLSSSLGTDERGDVLERVPHEQVLGGIAPEPGPEAVAERAELHDSVREALAVMPDEERTVIVLAYREELTQVEIAERLGWPLGTVKTRTRRALRRLRDSLEGRGGDGLPDEPATGDGHHGEPRGSR